MELFLQWDPAQVLSYLKTHIGHDVSATFIDNNIDGLLLPYITSEHLRELGIEPLATRLRVKRAIYSLIAGSSSSSSSGPLSLSELSVATLGAPQNAAHTPGAVSVSTSYSTTPTLSSFTEYSLLNNQLSLEALTLCQILVQDIFKRITLALGSGGPVLTTPGSVLRSDSLLGLFSTLASSEDVRKLNENFIKLKADLNPVIRLIKDSKPLPTPTLDPGIASQLPTLLVTSKNEHEGTHSSGSGSGTIANLADTLSPDTIGTLGGPADLIAHSSSTNSISANLDMPNPSSPTQSRRLSSATVLSMGVGKLTDLTSKLSLTHRLFNKARLVDSRLGGASPAEDRSLPREVDEHKRSDLAKSKRGSMLSPTSHYFHSNNLSHSRGTPGSLLNALTPQALGTQPLKQLKASSDDTCLKVLQQAMKRHHIPRNHWSKYVLVICYGDKERILKLTEKPVIVFKELQEHGKNPAIMLRELAPLEPDGSDKYEDSRIGDDIPGGTL